MTRFALADLERANAAWGCNCGPAALAAICGLTLDEVRGHFGSDWPGFTNVTAMKRALDNAELDYEVHSQAPGQRGSPWPSYGLARIQFEGPWTAPGANPRWAYRHTHWVGAMLPTNGAPSVWDINCVDDGPGTGNGWTTLSDWETRIVPALTSDIKRATGGWHITHAIEVGR